MGSAGLARHQVYRHPDLLPTDRDESISKKFKNKRILLLIGPQRHPYEA